jgi:hypothetical protein
MSKQDCEEKGDGSGVEVVMVRAREPKDKRFQIMWTALHLLAAINAAAVVMHLGSVKYHWNRATHAESDED